MQIKNSSRRDFIKKSTLYTGGVGLLGLAACKNAEKKKTTDADEDDYSNLFFKISLAQWSLHKALFDGTLTHLDFIKEARQTYDVDAVEYVNVFFKDKAEDKSFLEEMTHVAVDNNLRQWLIMVDAEGDLAELDDKVRMQSVENHYKWVHAAHHLNCSSIRVNCRGTGDPEGVKSAGIDGLGKLAEYAKDYDINVIVENHGGLSSNGSWLASVISQVNLPNCGTLPDFGNFCIKRKEDSHDCEEEYDRYKGTEELLPFAKGVSAKSHDFDADGNETHTDYMEIMKLVKDSGYTDYVGIEYEGQQLSEPEGIMATKHLLQKVGKELS